MPVLMLARPVAPTPPFLACARWYWLDAAACL